MDKRPIGVFDSGLGGLTVVKELMSCMPHEDIIYFGDTGRVPYGNRSKETILKYASQDIKFLLEHDVKMVIAACGTVSSVLTEDIYKKYDFPFSGVLIPAAQAAAATSASGRIGVIGTTATVHSGAYGKAIRNIRPDAKVIGRDCPLFVPLVENGYFGMDNQVARMIAEEYISPFLEEDIDTLILGCTHYPLLADIIDNILGYSVTLIDPGFQTARQAAAQLIQNNMLNQKQEEGVCMFYVSDSVEAFVENGQRFLRRPLRGKVEKVNIDTL